MAFRERQLVLLVLDLANFTRTVAGMEAAQIAELLGRHYTTMGEIIARHGGRVVKYMGDGGLVVFPAEQAVAALDAALEVRVSVRDLAAELDLEMDSGANIHLSTVAEGEFGPDAVYDVAGTGVIHAFRMGGGAGIRISEPVYRKLPSDRRGAWDKHQPPATYSLAAG